MAFNTGLSGLRAASVDLDVTGNNIANASTVGFKGSRVQFGDLYANGFLSSGTNPVGDGVRVQDVKQSFAQGNISFTDNGLDLAINGDGFFVLNNGGEVRYSRAGQFGIDKDGFVTNNQNMRVQGFQADQNGNLSGIRGDLQVDASNLAPRRTTDVQSELNLDSREGVLEVSGKKYQTVQPGAVNIDPDPDAAANISVPSFKIVLADGTEIIIPESSSAKIAAEQLNQQDNVSASARTEYFIPLSQIEPNQTVVVGGESFEIPDVGDEDAAASWLMNQINESSLRDRVNATIVPVGEEGRAPDVASLRLIESRGNNLTVAYQYETDAGTTINVNDEQVGSLDITLPVDAAEPTSDDLSFVTLDPFRINTFEPNDQRTYNHATSFNVFDSLGNSHELTQYFVKEPVSGGGNVWAMYVQIDGEDVGDPPAANGEASRARYELQFNVDGTLQSIDGDPNGEVLVSNWTPLDSNGDPNGADGPLLAADGGETPVPQPPTSSNFAINLAETTQFGSAFGVTDQRQNGYTTGRLSGLDVSDTGVLFARYTNGQSDTLGQVALASFRNTDGLAPVGETTWVETFDSGQPIVGQPDTGTLGSIKASSVEESNVDLSAELVNLIIAQRNYQANAKTIETSDAVTQTIINLR